MLVLPELSRIQSNPSSAAIFSAVCRISSRRCFLPATISALIERFFSARKLSKSASSALASRTLTAYSRSSFLRASGSILSFDLSCLRRSSSSEFIALVVATLGSLLISSRLAFNNSPVLEVASICWTMSCTRSTATRGGSAGAGLAESTRARRAAAGFIISARMMHRPCGAVQRPEESAVSGAIPQVSGKTGCVG